MDKDKLKEKLTEEQYRVTQECGTEPAFTGKLLHNKETGMYQCVVCGKDLFSSDTKFDSGSGWPSFYDVVSKGNVTLSEDTSHGMIRTEVKCANCGAHLGHMFPHSVEGNNDYYCINSAALNFEKKEEEK